MAVPRRLGARPNYQELNNLCSADFLYKPLKKRREEKSRVYTVERVISERKGKKVR